VNSNDIKLSIVYIYYKNVNALKFLIDIWKTYPDNIEIILVNDGSPLGVQTADII